MSSQGPSQLEGTGNAAVGFGYGLVTILGWIVIGQMVGPWGLVFAIPVTLALPFLAWDWEKRELRRPSRDELGGFILICGIASVACMGAFAVFGAFGADQPRSTPDNEDSSYVDDGSTYVDDGSSDAPADCGRLGGWVADQHFTGDEETAWLDNVQQCYDNQADAE